MRFRLADVDDTHLQRLTAQTTAPVGTSSQVTASSDTCALLLEGKRYGVEVKYADAPRVTKSMRIGISDLGLRRLHVVYPGTQRYPLAAGIEVLPLPDLLLGIQQLQVRQKR